VCVRSDLRIVTDAVAAILHEVHRPSCAATADKVGHAELGIRVDDSPRPNVAPALSLLFQCEVLCLRTAERPDLIRLQTAYLEAAHVAMVIFGTGAAHILNQLEDGMLRYASHADDGVDGVALYQSSNDLGALCGAQPIHETIMDG